MNKIKPKKFKETKFIVSDIESFENNNFRLICSYGDYKTDTYHFNLDNYFNYIHRLINIHKQIIIYFHFGGGFDFLHVLEGLRFNKKLGKHKIELIFSGSLIIEMRLIIDTNRSVIFKDSFGLTRSSLNAFSIAMLNKRKTELPFSMKNRDKINDEIMLKYCRMDCILLYDSLKVFEKEIDFSLFTTSPKTSMQYFKTFFLKSHLPRISVKEFDRIKDFAKAGRVEVFKRYGSNLIHLDINQAYPYIMYKYGCPVGHYVETFEPDFNKCGFFIVKINKKQLAQDYINFMPYSLDRLYFLNTKKPYYITTFEIELLIEKKIDFEIIEGFQYDLNKDFYKEYVTYFYNMRKENPNKKFISKIFLNALQGKMIQSLDYDRITINDDNAEFIINPELNIGITTPNRVTRDFHYPASPALIWSGTRAYLYRLMDKVKDNIYYCDTDSLCIDKKALPILKQYIGGELGELKIEKKYQKAIFLAPKVYCYVDENGHFDFKFKGLNQRDLKEKGLKLTWNDFEQALTTGKILIPNMEIEKINKFKTAIKNNSFLNFRKYRKNEFTFKLKRELLKDNINTKAFNL